MLPGAATNTPLTIRMSELVSRSVPVWCRCHSRLTTNVGTEAFGADFGFAIAGGQAASAVPAAIATTDIHRACGLMQFSSSSFAVPSHPKSA